MAEIVYCSNCKHFKAVPGMNSGLCDNKKALPFPRATDFCSYAEKADGRDIVQAEMDLLAKVYAQRR